MKKILPFLLFLSWACDDRTVDASKWKEEMKTHKFVKISDGEIEAEASAYSEKVLRLMDSLGVLTSPPFEKQSLDSVISRIEQLELSKTGVKLCLVKQDNLESCYPSVTKEITPDDTINKVVEIWKANKMLTQSPETFEYAIPQSLNEGSFILFTWPVFENGVLNSMWCLIFKRQIIVLNKIE